MCPGGFYWTRQVWVAMRAFVEGPRKRSVHFAPAQLDLPDRFSDLIPDAQGAQPLR